MLERKATPEAQGPRDQEVGMREPGENQELQSQSDAIKEPCKSSGTT